MWAHTGRNLEELFEWGRRRYLRARDWVIACCEQSVDGHRGDTERCWINFDHRDADLKWELVVGNTGKFLGTLSGVCGRSRSEQVPLTVVSRHREQRDRGEPLVEKRPIDHPREES
jgi:hypothetical protein